MATMGDMPYLARDIVSFYSCHCVYYKYRCIALFVTKKSDIALKLGVALIIFTLIPSS